MNKKSVKDVEVRGKRVFVRCDFNVPMKDGVITSDKRIAAAIPTIQYLLDNGAKAGSERPETPYKLGDRVLRNGSEGADVEELQTLLIKLAEKQNDTAYLVGSYGADGDFGDSTESAVRAFQRDYALSIDGIVGAKTLDRLYAALESGGDGPVEKQDEVSIFGGSAYIRTEPDISGAILGTVHSGDRYPYAGETSENGWNKIVYAPEAEGWVSGKYSKIEGA